MPEPFPNDVEQKQPKQQLFPLVPQGIMAADRTVSAFGGGRVGNRNRFFAIGSFRAHQVKL